MENHSPISKASTSDGIMEYKDGIERREITRIVDSSLQALSYKVES